MKRLLILLLAMTFSLMSVVGADFYSTFEFSASQETPQSVYIEGAECSDTQCSSKTQRSVEVFSGDARVCLEQGLNGDFSSTEEFNSCIEQYREVDSVVESQFAVVKYEVPSSFGYLTYFSASDDSYLPWYNKKEDFSCEGDICIENTQGNQLLIEPVSFVKKDDAIAEIGQVAIRNIENDLKPVQIEVPVEIEQTVCSAYRRSLENVWEPTIPSGYSDYNADTMVNLEITQTRNGNQLHSDQVMLPIEADNCASFAAFEWTPDSNLENESVTFSFTTQVIDNQVSNSLIDRYEVTEVVYPTNLDNTCWGRIEGYTLTNVPNQELTTSIAQITQGESLYATLDVGAFKDNAITPTDYELEIEIDGIQYYSDTFSTQSQGLDSQVINLTQYTSSFPVGEYDVVARATPQATNCNLVEPVEHNQQLNILEVEQYSLDVLVQNTESMPIEGASVQLELLEAQDDFATAPQYDSTLQTGQTGRTSFDNLMPGGYRYSISAQGYSSKQGLITVGSDSTLQVTLQQDNQAPVVDLPQEFNANVNDGIVIDLENYISDANQGFSSLQLSSNVISGTAQATISNGELIVTTQNPQNVVIEVSATDAQGLSGNDSTTIVFTTSTAPEILVFEATPDNGEAPFETTFTIEVQDLENDSLTCTVEFGDSTSITQNCVQLQSIQHTYLQPGTYRASLSVTDGNFADYQELQIVVFTRDIPEEYDKLEAGDVKLNVPMTIVPGEFDFNITIKDETLTTRELFVEPSITCGDVTSKLASGNSQLPTRIISKESRGEFSYGFTIDTQDFKNNIAKDTSCSFNAVVLDGQGTNIKKSEFVEFSYPQKEAEMLSIRGETTDIISYMDIALQSADFGYNRESFRLINNEDIGKEISLTITSASLGINKNVKVNLGPNSQRDTSISYFVGNVNSGSYPVRISINDGSEHQTRYSYIRVE